MNENELLARWLGVSPTIRKEANTNRGSELYDKRINFRTSNEWAGALLEKLPFSFNLEKSGDQYRIFGYPKEGFAGLYCAITTEWVSTWRDAVVDAVLKLIEQETHGQTIL